MNSTHIASSVLYYNITDDFANWSLTEKAEWIISWPLHLFYMFGTYWNKGGWHHIFSIIFQKNCISIFAVVVLQTIARLLKFLRSNQLVWWFGKIVLFPDNWLFVFHMLLNQRVGLKRESIDAWCRFSNWNFFFKKKILHIKSGMGNNVLVYHFFGFFEIKIFY